MSLKKYLNRVLIVWAMLMAIAVIFGDVSVAATDAGRTSADFLLIGSGARAAGLAGAYSAVSEGVSAAYWNPSGLAGLERGEVALSHFSWYQDITVEQVGAAFPVRDNLSLAASVSFVNYGTIEGYDVSGASVGDVSAYDLAGGVSAGYGLTEALSAGATVKYISSKLDDYSASAFAVDLGLKYNFPRFSLAAVLTNLGTEMKYDLESEKLPTAAKVGVAARLLDAGLVTSLELEKRIYGDFLIRQGVELGFSDQYYLRTGYDYLPSQNGRSLATGMCIGAGIRLDFLEIDYAYTPNDKSTAEDLHRFSLLLPLVH